METAPPKNRGHSVYRVNGTAQNLTPKHPAPTVCRHRHDPMKRILFFLATALLIAGPNSFAESPPAVDGHDAFIKSLRERKRSDAPKDKGVKSMSKPRTLSPVVSRFMNRETTGLSVRGLLILLTPLSFGASLLLRSRRLLMKASCPSTAGGLSANEFGPAMSRAVARKNRIRFIGSCRWRHTVGAGCLGVKFWAVPFTR